MPRLPDVNSLGNRPIPSARRTVATQRNRGAVAEAAGQFGAGIADFANRAIEKQDKLAYSAAKASLLKADLEARAELQDDPDYGTFEKRYNERMAKAREGAGKLIKSNSDRSLFDQDSDLDVTRGLAEVRQLARGKETSAGLAALDQGLFDLQDVGQNALDEGTRSAALAAMGEMIDGAVSKGYLTPEKAGELRRKTGQDYEVQSIRGRIAREDYSGARTLFERSRGRLDGNVEAQLEAAITGAEQGREALTLAGEYYNGARSPVGITEPGQKVPSEPDKPRVLKPGESARVNYTNVATSVAAQFGLSPVDVAAVMSYETGGTFSPTIMGGKGGNYMGLIQFGREERAKYGITKSSTPEQWTRAITGFLKDRGFKKGMGVLDLYSTINAGTPGRYNASDGNGTVRSHVDTLLSKHRGNAKRWLKTGGVEVNQEYTASEELPDISSIYDKIDADAVTEGWTPEKTERIKTAVAKRVDRDRAILNQKEDDAYDVAMAKAVEMGEDFTDVSQLGEAFDKASPQQRNTLQNIAQANDRAIRAESNAAAKERITDAYRRTEYSLDTIEQDNPKKFATMDLSQFFPGLSPAKRLEYTKRQEKVAAALEGWTPYSGITAAVTRATSFGGMKLQDEQKLAIRQTMQAEAERVFKATGKDLTPKDYDSLFLSATRDVETTGFLGGKGTKKRYDLDAGNISDSARDQIETAFKRQFGREPNEDEIMTWYRRHFVPKAPQ